MPRAARIVIVGAGFGGIAAAIELQKHGFRYVTILERGPELGGTWLHNGYPGAACDVPSHLYSFSFAQRRDWSCLCSSRDEILAYLHDVAREFGVDRLVVGDTEVASCTWADDTRRWELASVDGRTWDANAVVIATGQLHRAAIPSIEGLEGFAGHSFHSAQWDHDFELTGKRVAVVGTGASAVQFVPEIARVVDRLIVFQRSGNWFLPRKNRPYPAAVKAAVQHVPGVQACRRRFIFGVLESLTMMFRNPGTWGQLGHAQSSAFMRWQLKDPEIRRKAWPDYTFGCKRVLFSSHYLPTLQRPNVELVTDAITAFSPQGVLTDTGAEHEIDCVIWATGFRTRDFMFPMEIVGAQGQTLREAWARSPHAHLGVAVPGFPSMFVMYGPNTNTSAGSIIVYLEAQAAYLRQALQLINDHGAAAIDVRPDVEANSDRELQARFDGTAWTRCDSWYRNAEGRIVTNWPGYMREYIEQTRTLDPSQYAFLEMPDHANVATT
ncbi:MAG: flavin-containing monooxygenase [Solirubrobacteraceae bacterium]